MTDEQERDAAAIGQRINRLRTARGLTQRDIALPRYTAAYVSSVESGKRVPSGDALAHFADRLGVTFQELATGRPPDAAVRLDLEILAADMADDPDVAEAAYRNLAAEAARLGEPVRRAHCRLGLGRLALARDDLRTAARAFEEAESLLGDGPPHEAADAIAGRAGCLRRGGDARYAAYLLVSARHELQAGGYPDPGALLALNAQLALCHAELGDDAAAASAAADALALAGYPAPAAVAGLHRRVAESLLAAGRTGPAATAAAQARDAWRQATLGIELASCRRVRGRARGAEGDLAGAAEDLAAAHRAFSAVGDSPTTTAHGTLSTTEDPAAAPRAFSAVDRTELALDVAVELAEVHRRVGQLDRAETLLRAALAAGTSGLRAARATRELGLLAIGRGDPVEAERRLRAAVASYRRTGPRRELARAVRLLGDLVAEQDRLAEATLLFLDGLADVEKLGERPDGGHRH